MAKDTFWFPHDFEPTSDPKIQALLGEYGGTGYGIYWRIVEMLHSDSEHKLPLKNYIYIAIAKQMSANAKQSESKHIQQDILPETIKIFITECITLFELFESDDIFFWSNRVHKNIQLRSEISKVRSESGKRGAIAKQNQAKDRIGYNIKGNTKNNNVLVKNGENGKFSGNFKSQGEEFFVNRVEEGLEKLKESGNAHP